MLRLLVAVLIAGVFAAAASPSQSLAASLAAQTNDTAGVRVVVTPKSIGADAAWEFEVTMDTHTQPLTEDLVRGSVLVVGDGRRITPTAWEGDAPGGHHRKGVLKFPAPTEAIKTFELQIDAIGGAARTFRWELK
jgi:hypothetical protein